MIRINWIIATLGFVVGFGMVRPASAFELVSNGGFETGDFSSWLVALAGSGSDVNVDPFAHTGTYSAKFAADAGEYDSISQGLGTLNGQQYTLSFWVYNNGVGNDSLQVFWEGGLVTDDTPVSSPLEDWSMYSFPVTATANGSDLRIRGFDGAGSFYLDDISVVEVPEPATCALAIVGAAFAVRRRRR